MSRHKDFEELWEELGRNIYRRVEEIVREMAQEQMHYANMDVLATNPTLSVDLDKPPIRIVMNKPQRTYTYEQLQEMHGIAKDKSLGSVRAEFYGKGNRSRKKLNAHPLIIDAAKRFGKTTDGVAQKIIRIWDSQV